MSSQNDLPITVHVDAHGLSADGLPETLTWHMMGQQLSAILAEFPEHSEPSNPSPELLQRIGAELYSAFLEHLLVDNASAPDVVFSFRHATHSPGAESAHPMHELELLADEAIEADDTARALKLIQNAMAHFRKSNDPLGVARCTIRGAELLLEGGSYHKTAFEWLSNGLEAYAQEYRLNPVNPQNTLWVARALIGLSRLCDFDGRPLDAWHTIHDFELNIQDVPAAVRGALLSHMAQVASKLERPDDAISLFRDAISSLRNTNEIPLLAETHTSLAHALLSSRDLQGAKVHFEEALHLAINDNDTDLISDLNFSLSLIAFESNDLAAAWDLAITAVANIDEDEVIEPAHLSLLLKVAAAHDTLPDEIDHYIIMAQQRLTSDDLSPEASLDIITYLFAIASSFGALAIGEPLLAMLAATDRLTPLPAADNLPLLIESILSFADQAASNPDTAHLTQDTLQLAYRFADAAQLHQLALISLTGLARDLADKGLLDDAFARLEVATQLANDAQLNPAELFSLKASVLRARGQFESARIDLLDALKHHRVHNAAPETIGLTHLAIAEINLDLAEIAFTDQTLKQPAKAFDASARGAILLASADLRAAIANADRNLRESSQYLDDAVLQQSPLYLLSLGRLNTLHSDTEAALEPFHKASLLSQDVDPETAVDATCRLAESLLFLQKPTEAYQSINTAWQLADASGSSLALTFYLRTAARIAFMIGDKDTVISLLSQALASARKLDNPFLNRVMHLEANLLVILRQSPDYN